ncbi:dehydrogenase [Poseidonibacter lekithochrous]|uniref:D-glycero-D-manno-heptose 7-phosphate kinase n=1 Tax=Poseidonibacter lekithochrous TaxID=1904463 RepID=UPI0008FC6A29|nr:dehydrogenase [Poseidonibacter lekithochrous]QKJ22276.1 sugar kinase [Poseidonibacter lekithochrous]
MIIRSKAPLRLGLAGGGTDLNTYCDKFDGYVLNATISLYVHCTIEERFDSKILFESTDINQVLETDSNLKLELDGQMDLYKGIYNRMVKDYIEKPLSFSLTTYSDVPSGSGLGGSSTLVVAIIKAFVEWLNLPLGEYDIARLAFDIEREDIGIIGGAQDQYAATFGGFNFMEFYDKKRVIVNPLRIKNWIIDELEASMVLYFTNITRQASQIEKEKKSLLSDAKSLDAMHEVKKDAVLIKEALLKGEINNFARILGKSWSAKKRVSSSISNNEIDKIYDLAIKNGAYSGKVSGAGGGGFMFFMVNPLKKLKLVRELNKQQGEVINFMFVKDGTKGWKI